MWTLTPVFAALTAAGHSTLTLNQYKHEIIGFYCQANNKLFMREPFNNDCYFPRSECVFRTVLSRDMLDTEWTQNQILILFQVCQYVGSSDVSVAPFCLFISTKSTNKESCCKKLVSCLMMCCLVVFRSDISPAKTVAGQQLSHRTSQSCSISNMYK